jgi:hypothetical protein
LAGRAGATLTEVLMAILIMAVGVISVFTLFPISVLRTIQATQQTNSKILKYNVDELVKSSPGLLTTFDDPTGTAFTYAFGGPLTLNYLGSWQPQRIYVDGDVVVPVIGQGALQPTPLIWYRADVTLDTTLMPPPTDVYSGTDEPDWLLHSPTIEDASTGASGGTIEWHPVRSAASFLPLSYVVDPLGYWTASVDGSVPSEFFGSTMDTTTGVATDNNVGLLRIHGGIASSSSELSRRAAALTCALPDSWEQIFSGPPASATTTVVDFPPAAALTQVTQAAAELTPHRLILTSSDRRSTVYRTISDITGQQVNLAESIPVRFPTDAAGNLDIGNAEVEALTLRYTWFLTVRNTAQGTPAIKCVIVFNRNFAGGSEHAYGANFGNPDLDVDGGGVDDGLEHGLPDNSAGPWVKIIWDSATEPDPLLKRGNYVFDSRNVDWYRIQDIHDSGTASGIDFAVLILERNVRRQTLVPAELPPDPAVIDGRAILMPGIVEVFDL